MRALVHVAFAAMLSFGGVLLLHEASIYNTPTTEAPDPYLAPLATSSDASYNWSGYVAEGGHFSAVSGTWIVPDVVAHQGADLSADATWVGIGGAGTSDLIQAGTQALADSEGAVVYSAWYELLPDASRPVALEVRAGDTITAAITSLGNDRWHIMIINNTTGNQHTRTVLYHSAAASAEWIQEMPSFARGRGFIPLNDFGAVTFLAGSAVKNGEALSIAAADAAPLHMTNRQGEPLALPTALSPQGAFSVLRTDALSTPHPGSRRYLLLQDL